jgi:putative transposase
VKAHQATYPVRAMSRLLSVSASGFYAWLKRPLSKRALEDIALTAKIHAIHRRSGEAYGAPSIHAELADEHGIRVGRKRVARLMRVAGIKGLQPTKFVTTTIADPDADRALDQVDRQFCAEGPDRLWVADISVPQQAA